MKFNSSTLITAVSLLVALTSVSFAVKARKQRKLAIAEMKAMQQQMAEQKSLTPRRRSPEPQRPTFSASAETNAAGLVALQTTTAEPAEGEQEKKKERPQRESFEDRMAKMKAEDPEGYAEMVQKRGERQQEMRYNLAERTATFMDLDTSNMTVEERANHEMLVEKMANIWALSDQFQDPEQAPNREAMGEMFNEMREARPLMAQERTIMFKQLGADLGYEGEDSQVFATHVEEIISATSMQMPTSRGGRGGGGGGDRGGGGGGGDRGGR
jgi:hypothetical protein